MTTNSDRDDLIARCKASGMDDEMAEEFADEVIESAPAEEERARHRLAEHAKQFVAEAPPSRAKQQRRAFH